MKSGVITFGDTVRIKSTEFTEELGLAGLIGSVYGETTPSVTDVDVIGDAGADFAINVYFKEKGEGWWFREDLLEFIDHSPGTTVTLEGVDKEWVRNADGDWIEYPTDPIGAKSKPWWKFWTR